MDEQLAHPPETVEGWYVLHQIYALDRAMLRVGPLAVHTGARRSAAAAMGELSAPSSGGWSAVVPLTGSRADVMLVHLRPTFDGLGEVQAALARQPLFDAFRPVYSFLSVTEAGLYHLSAEMARGAAERGGSYADAESRAAIAERASRERENPHVLRRLFPTLPPGMPYVCFYPMSKRRDAGQNWYTLTLEERSRLMTAHGTVGRRYAGRVIQVISGAIGLDAWEWGVTLFAADPLDFKKLVTDMRFDETSAKYAEFGDFYVGKVADVEQWVEKL